MCLWSQVLADALGSAVQAGNGATARAAAALLEQEGGGDLLRGGSGNSSAGGVALKSV